MQRDSLHYSLLFTTRTHATLIRAGVHLADTLHAISQHCTQLPPTLARLRWWREELDRLAQGTAQHPACLPIQGILAATDLDPWQRLLHGLQAQLIAEPPETPQHWWALAHQTGGALEMQYAKWQGVTDPTALAAAASLGGAAYAWIRLTQLRWTLALGCCPLPQNLLRPERLHAARICAEPQTVGPLLQALLRLLHAQLQAAKPALIPMDQRIRAELLLSLISEVETDAALLLTHQVSLTPLRHFGIAVRCAFTRP